MILQQTLTVAAHALLSGGEKQRQFWRHYYRDAQAVVFVVDSACTDDEMAVARTALHDALADSNLADLPCLLIANCQDKIGARTQQQVGKSVHGCSRRIRAYEGQVRGLPPRGGQFFL